MRLKKVFAGALAAAMLVCAVAVPAFAAEEVEQEKDVYKRQLYAFLHHRCHSPHSRKHPLLLHERSCLQ